MWGADRWWFGDEGRHDESGHVWVWRVGGSATCHVFQLSGSGGEKVDGEVD